MLREICQHGHDITNKTTSTGVAVCPEGCLSNDQRAQENKTLCLDLAEAQDKVRRLTELVKQARPVMVARNANAELAHDLTGELADYEEMTNTAKWIVEAHSLCKP